MKTTQEERNMISDRLIDTICNYLNVSEDRREELVEGDVFHFFNEFEYYLRKFFAEYNFDFKVVYRSLEGERVDSVDVTIGKRGVTVFLTDAFRQEA